MSPRDMPTHGTVTTVCHHAPGKRRFPTRDAAVQGHRALRGAHIWPQHPYECPACGWWHLTSRRPR